jgi:hypothetical protein
MTNIPATPTARAKQRKIESRCSVTVIVYLTSLRLSSYLRHPPQGGRVPIILLMNTACDFFFLTTASVGGVIGSSFLSMYYFTRTTLRHLQDSRAGTELDITKERFVVRLLRQCPRQFTFGVNVPLARTNFATLELGEVGIFGQVGNEYVFLSGHTYSIQGKSMFVKF